MEQSKQINFSHNGQDYTISVRMPYTGADQDVIDEAIAIMDGLRGDEPDADFEARQKRLHEGFNDYARCAVVGRGSDNV